MQTVPTSFEPIVPDFLDPVYKKPHNLYRFNKAHSGSGRWYVKWHPRKEVAKTYVSVSTFMNSVLPKEYGFLRWVASKGPGWEAFASDRAVFGTVYHGVSMKPLVTGGGFNFNSLLEKAHQDSVWNNYQMLFPRAEREKSMEWFYAFTRGLMSFWQFCQERIVKVLAVELPIVSDKYGIGATLDLVCLVKFGKKTVLAIIDLKSKVFYLMSDDVDKKFYRSHQLQLEIQKMLLVDQYKGMIDEYAEGNPNNVMLFNWAPNAWKAKVVDGPDGPEIKGGPSWTFQNQTDNEFRNKVSIPRSRIQMNMAELKVVEAQTMGIAKPPSHIVEIGGEFENLGEFDWTNMVRMVDIE